MKLFKNILFVAAVSALVSSCATDNKIVPQAVGDAAVDAATKNVDPITKSAIRSQTGYGTNPIESQAAGLLKSLSR